MIELSPVTFAGAEEDYARRFGWVATTNKKSLHIFVQSRSMEARSVGCV